MLTGCFAPKPTKDGPPKTYRDISQIKQPIPQHLPKSRYGNPTSYRVRGVTYHVRSSAVGYHVRGIASWYGSKFTHRLTSTREQYDPYKMTAASPTLPIPCFVRVTNLSNGRSVIVKVNDRGPFAPNRVLDLSYAAAVKLGYVKRGTALVDIQAINTVAPVLANARPLDHPSIFLQVGAFRSLNHANQLKIHLAQQTHHSALIKQSGAFDPIYRVQIGPIESTQEADRVQANLFRSGFRHTFTIIK